MFGTRAKVVLGCTGALALAVTIGMVSGEVKGQPKKTEVAAAPKPPPRLAVPLSGCGTRFAIRRMVTKEESAKTCQELTPLDKRWKILSLSGKDQDVTPWHPTGGSKPDTGSLKPDAGKAVQPPARIAPPPRKDPASAAYQDNEPGFCVYEWREKTTLPQAEDFARIGAQPECGLSQGMAVTAGPPATVLKDRAAAFERHARGVRETAREGAATTFARAVRRAAPRAIVAVVDASPHGASKTDTSGHGFAVSRVIADLACDKSLDPDCEKTVIRPYVALPLVPDGAGGWVHDFKDGGFVGYFHDLFRAFRKALDDWEKDERKPHLIINLSLGWDPIKTDETSAETIEMRRLLERAYCKGVLVIAAAGNTTGSEGAVMPAALESHPPRCRPPGPATEATYRPLIHAVGAVDQWGERLSLSRPWGEPRLVAYGSQVTVPTGEADKFILPLTGSSISAAVVSGIAAVVWSAKPRLDAAGVMALIYEAGDKVDPAAGHAFNRTEVCLATPRRPCDTWPVRRATLCTSLKKLDPSAKMTCEAPEPFPKREELAEPASKPANVTEPCRLEHCGEAVGPHEQQLPAFVLPMPGAATCATCEFKLGSFSGRLIGTARGTPEVVSGIVSTKVRSKQSLSSYQDYNLSPVPVAGKPFAQTYYLSATPSSAEIHWIYDVGIGTYVNTNLRIVR